MPKSKFYRNSTTYRCIDCKKLTRDTGRGEADLEMCAACYTAGEYENEHNDGGHATPEPCCPICNPDGWKKANKLE